MCMEREGGRLKGGSIELVCKTVASRIALEEASCTCKAGQSHPVPFWRRALPSTCSRSQQLPLVGCGDPAGAVSVLFIVTTSPMGFLQEAALRVCLAPQVQMASPPGSQSMAAESMTRASCYTN